MGLFGGDSLDSDWVRTPSGYWGRQYNPRASTVANPFDFYTGPGSAIAGAISFAGRKLFGGRTMPIQRPGYNSDGTPQVRLMGAGGIPQTASATVAARPAATLGQLLANASSKVLGPSTMRAAPSVAPLTLGQLLAREQRGGGRGSDGGGR